MNTGDSANDNNEPNGNSQPEHVAKATLLQGANTTCTTMNTKKIYNVYVFLAATASTSSAAALTRPPTPTPSRPPSREHQQQQHTQKTHAQPTANATSTTASSIANAANELLVWFPTLSQAELRAALQVHCPPKIEETALLNACYACRACRPRSFLPCEHTDVSSALLACTAVSRAKSACRQRLSKFLVAE